MSGGGILFIITTHTVGAGGKNGFFDPSCESRREIMSIVQLENYSATPGKKTAANERTIVNMRHINCG